MKITVVVPTYNEAHNLPALVRSLLALPLDLRVLIVDDASPDGTGAIADDLARQQPARVRVLHRHRKRGLREAYIEGFAAALADAPDAIAQMDADLSHDPLRLVAMAEALAANDLVLGSRYVPGGSVDAHWPLWRRGLSAWGNFYARSILRIPLRDVTTGYRLWRREALARVCRERLHSSGYVFLVEMAYLAERAGLRIAEVPIHFADRKLGDSKMSLDIQLEAALRVFQVRLVHRARTKRRAEPPR